MPLCSVHLFSLPGYTLSIAMSQENEPTSKDRDEFKFLNLNLCSKVSYTAEENSNISVFSWFEIFRDFIL